MRPIEARPGRRVVCWHFPGLIADVVGHPGLYGLAAFREHRSDVIEELLLRGLAVVGVQELDRTRWDGR